jgi:hypothetical protein
MAPADIAYAFASSQERESQRVTADYLQYLGRSPSTSEVANWVAAFESGSMTNEDVLAGFVGSLEYFQKQKSSPQYWFDQAILSLYRPGQF